ncbi:MAG: translation factor GTPase family protein [Eubacterium sp.]|mgnify:FL=1|nr:translation factor GTPase family protein [Eubacterium sp.]
MKQLILGILAHVDAGKTTLSEALLYTTGNIRKLGRVDHKDAFLDTYSLERERGITIFSKQAQLKWKNENEEINMTLLDTPGHVDFSAEMERTLQVLDYGILVVSGSDGVQGHTETLWKLLKRYNIPTFIFVNKMDLAGSDKNHIMENLKSRLDTNCVDFSDYEKSDDNFLENVATCDENVLENYMDTGEISNEEITNLIAERKVFPCFFGSALKLDGIELLLNAMANLTKNKSYSDEFGARVYKISRDSQGNRLTHMKVTGGVLKVKDVINDEKVNQIRIYSGNKFETKDSVKAGEVCAVTGLENTRPGQGIGDQEGESIPVLEPVLTYQIILPEGCDAHNTFNKLKQLEEEDPQLDIVWNENLKEIHARLMGDVQIEILQSLIKERFDIDVTFGQGSIVYKETIKNKVEGIGHFEPLRHYAEVHLLLEPGEPGSGMVFETACKEDDLDKNWQRLILTHLYEKQHVGVLTGSHITDMKITLIGGRAHAKHTEGGDFRQATYRAVRNGLKQAESVLLEPYYEFTLEVPTENVGRAMNDISQMKGEFETPKTNGEVTEITGYAPVSTMSGYITTVNTYTRGRGRLYCKLAGYMPCHNASEVIMEINYDSERDVENPTGSVFCAYGAGFNVEWDKVKDYAHVTTDNLKDNDYEEPEKFVPVKQPEPGKKWQMGASYAEDKELQAIFEKQFGPVKRRLANETGFGYTYNQGSGKKTQKKYVYKENKNKKNEKKYLLVDGYNVIFAWKELNELAQVNLDGARLKLMDIMSNYQGYKQCELILVFDAYKVKGNIGEVSKYNNINVVYTKEAETADTYIEKVTNEIGKKYQVTVATSDRLEQMIVLSRGAVRMSSNELLQDVMAVHEAGLRQYKSSQKIEKNYLDELINK